MTEKEKYNNFLNEIKGYTEEQLLGEDNGIGDDRAILLLLGLFTGMFVAMVIASTILVFMVK